MICYVLQEWKGFIENLSDAVQQQLTESHIQTFTDLTDAERTLFIDKAAKQIHGGTMKNMLTKCKARGVQIF